MSQHHLGLHNIQLVFHFCLYIPCNTKCGTFLRMSLQQQTQATDIKEEEIRMSINLPYPKGTSDKQWCKFRSYKVRFAKTTL